MTTTEVRRRYVALDLTERQIELLRRHLSDNTMGLRDSHPLVRLLRKVEKVQKGAWPGGE